MLAFFFGRYCFIAKVLLIHKKNLANLWVQAKNESRFLKISFNIFGYLLEPCIEIYGNLSWILCQNMAIENLTKLMSLALFKKIIYKILAEYSPKRNGCLYMYTQAFVPLRLEVSAG
jgi:hypothetical protein